MEHKIGRNRVEEIGDEENEVKEMNEAKKMTEENGVLKGGRKRNNK